MLISFILRRGPIALAVLAAVLAGCSSTPTGSSGGSGAPASITVSGGAGQSAAPGSALPTPVSVLVTDASGQPVAGVGVTFAIDSGGGSLSSTAAVTGSNGVATAGIWTLGSTAGRNTITASVAGLARLTISAVGSTTGSTLPTMSVGTGGGSIVVTDAGPLKGFELDVPPAAFGTTLQITLGSTSTASVPHLAGSTVVTPVLTISSSIDAYATAPLTMRIPAVVPSGSVPLVVLYDPASGAEEALSTLAWDSAGVTVLIGHLSAPASLSLRTVVDSRTGWPASALSGTTYEIATILTPQSVVISDMSTGFLPGQNDWEFHATPTVIDTQAITIGATTTELWYYVTHAGGPLWQQYQLAPGVELSDRSGIRWASVVDAQAEGTYFSAFKDVLTKRFQSIGNATENQFLTIRTLMAQSFNQPQLVVLGNFLGSTPLFLPVIVYKAVGNQLFIADPQAPGDRSRSLTFSALGAMTPYLGADGIRYTFPFPTAVPSVVPVASIAAGFQQLVTGTIGDAEYGAFPYELHSKYGVLGDTIWVPDTLRVWAQCAACTPVVTSPAAPEATASLTNIDDYLLTPAGWAFQVSTTVGNLNQVGVAAPATSTSGFVLSALGTAVGAGSPKNWLDWVPITVITVKDAVVATALATTAEGTPVTFSQQPIGALPAHVLYSWDFNDGTAKVAIQDSAMVQHTYAQSGVYRITGQILNVTTRQPLAVATLVDTVGSTLKYVWRFNQFSTPSVVLPAGGIGSEQDDTLVQAIVNSILSDMHQTPANGLVFAAKSLELHCGGIQIEDFPGGSVVDTGFVSDSTVFPVATNCTDDPTTTGSFSIGTLGTGQLIGDIHYGAGIADVAIGGSLNGQMNGVTLTGTLTWNVEYTSGAASYTVNFQATQIVPVPPAGLHARRARAGP